MDFKYKDASFNGVLIADRTGDIFFLNSDNLEKLPKDPENVPGRN